MGKLSWLALACAACSADLPVGERESAVEVVVAAPADITCLAVTFRELRGAVTVRTAPIAPTTTFSAVPHGWYQVTAVAFAGVCSQVPAEAPWATLAPLPLVVGGGSARLTLALYRPSRTTLSIPWTGSFLSSASGDFLGDGSTVVVLGGPSWENAPTPFLAVRVGDDGRLSDVTPTLLPDAPGAVHAREAVAVELNGDGRPDFFSANHGWDFAPYPGEGQTLLLSAPDGTLTDASATLPPITQFVHSVAAGDVRRVGRSDLLVGSLGVRDNPGLPDIYRGPNTAGDAVGPYLLRGEGGGALAYDNTSLPAEVAMPSFGGVVAPGQFTAATFADVDGDEWPDLVLASLEDSDRAGVVYLNDGQGRFTTAPRLLPVGSFGAKNTISVDVVATDVSGDGHLDLLLSQTGAAPFYSGRRIQVLVNDGTGHFADATDVHLPGQSGTGNWAQALLVVDFDDDEDLDLLLQVDHPHADDTLLYLNDGGVFAPAPAAMLPARRSLVPVDFDHDGRVDLLSFAPDGAVLTVTAHRR